MFDMFCPNCGKENDPSVRHCKSCGSFIPDFSSAESSGTNDALNFSETSDAPQPMTFKNLSQDDIKDLNNNTSRYQEYTMSDVVAKKSRKKLIIAIIAIAAVIGLGVASFFIIRSIISGNTVKSIQEDPTKYVFDSYRATAESMTANNAVVKSATASTNEQKTVKTTISYNDSSQSTIYSVDALAKKFFGVSKKGYDRRGKLINFCGESIDDIDHLAVRIAEAVDRKLRLLYQP